MEFLWLQCCYGGKNRMISDDTINKYIRDVLVTIIDDPTYLVIKADQKSPRKDTPYCTVKVMASKSSSLEEFSEVDEGLTEVRSTTKAMRNVLVSFNFFKQGVVEHDPFYVAGLCRQALARQSICEALDVNGLGLATRSQVKNLTFNLDSVFEERAGFNATFNLVDTDSELLNTIGEVIISGKAQINGREENMDIIINNN